MSQLSMKDRIKNEAKGISKHPIGRFQGVVEDVRSRIIEVSGQEVFDIVVRTSEGTAKVGIFRTTFADIDAGYGGRLNRVAAEERYCKTIGRLCRLYRDLGIEEPDGETEHEIEAKAFGWLGHLKGRPCTLVSQDDRRKPGEHSYFINAPDVDAPAAIAHPQMGTPAPRVEAPAPGTRQAQPRGYDPAEAAIDDIPF